MQPHENLSLENIWYNYPETEVLTEEKWKPILDYEKLYLISDTGRVISLPSERNGAYNKKFISNKKVIRSSDRLGYRKVSLMSNGIKVDKTVHRLIAQSFLLNPENKKTVNHKDGNKSNNFIWNLEWSTYSENKKHSYDIGLHIPLKGKEASWSKEVHKYSKINGNYVESFFSVTEAENRTNIKKLGIYNVCNRKCRMKSTGNYFWSYTKTDNYFKINAPNIQLL